MLTAFNYYEPEEENRIHKKMKKNPFFEQELGIAEKFARNHPSNPEKRIQCVVCGGSRLSYFYEKWGVNYLRCEDCYSVVADVKEETIAEYIGLKELQTLRLSEEYQKNGTEGRQQKWEEFLDWLKYRTFRYCGRNTRFSVLNYGTRWEGVEQFLRKSDLCETYELRDSILENASQESGREKKPVDIVLALDYIQQKIKPAQFFREAHNNLKKGGLFILGTKVGSGFDILSLRENNRNVFPYEHVLMPSREGIEILFSQAGFELLEFTTPGTFDLNYVKSNRDGLASNDYFMKYFLDTATASSEAEFQRFIQKSGLSSYAQVIARRMD